MSSHIRSHEPPAASRLCTLPRVRVPSGPGARRLANRRRCKALARGRGRRLRPAATDSPFCKCTPQTLRLTHLIARSLACAALLLSIRISAPRRAPPDRVARRVLHSFLTAFLTPRLMTPRQAGDPHLRRDTNAPPCESTGLGLHSPAPSLLVSATPSCVHSVYTAAVEPPMQFRPRCLKLAQSMLFFLRPFRVRAQQRSHAGAAAATNPDWSPTSNTTRR